MEKFSDKFDNFSAELLDLAYTEFTQSNLQYKELKCYLDTNQERYYKLLNTYNDEDLQFITDYIDKLILQSSCSNRFMYSAGYKHCIRLLQELSVL
ncbi:hypothetical protein PV797_11200 [Clostridiaceae bacterium M8S5]|nr:hypothetical protein PV797_11200 [Clostridiaceae bacterium M8S5]